MVTYCEKNIMKAWITPRYFVATTLLFLLINTGYSQNIIVGIVADINNKPIENVKVSSENNPNCVFTNVRGEYSITVSDTCTFLTFSTAEMSVSDAINGRKIINLLLNNKKSSTREKSYRFNVMLNAGGPVVWGSVSGSILLADFMSLDAGLGLGKAYGGTTIYLNSPFKNTNWQPYVGANIAYFEEFMDPTSTLIYMPAGLRYLNHKGTSISFEAGFLFSNNDRFFLETPVWGGIRFGKYF